MTTAREYLRVSKGRGKTARSITDQHTDNVIAEEDHGPWTFGEAYVDTGSASKFATKSRDDFDRLTADLRTGAFGDPGTVLVLWEISRLSRETGRGVELVDLCEAGKYKIHVTSEERTFDPTNYGDRYSLVTGVAEAEKEARRLSARTLRGVNSASRKGAPHGVIPFGYQRTYALVDGRSRPVEQSPRKDEATLVVEAYRRVLAGESIRAVAQDWTERGITSRKGTPFSPQNLRAVLVNKAYTGVRTHNGRETPGAWPVVAEYEGSGTTGEQFTGIFNQVQALLADPSRRSHTGRGVKHALSMTLRCDVCGGPMAVTYRRAAKCPLPPAYQCRDKACVRITKDGVDDEVTGAIIAYVTRLRGLGALDLSADADAPELAAVRAELGTKRAELWELDAMVPRKPEEIRLRARAIEDTKAEIDELEARARELSRPNRLGEVFGGGEDPAALWAALPVTGQREIAAIVLAPALLGEVRIMRAPRPGLAVPAAERLHWHQEPHCDHCSQSVDIRPNPNRG